jgi:hypothetical protein
MLAWFARTEVESLIHQHIIFFTFFRALNKITSLFWKWKKEHQRKKGEGAVETGK